MAVWTFRSFNALSSAIANSGCMEASLIERLVLHDNTHNFIDAFSFPLRFQGVSGAFFYADSALGANTAAGTAAVVNDNAACTVLNCQAGAALHAGAAADAFLAVPQDLQARFLTLRVGAPSAFQGASLEENHSADARSIIDAELLDIENHSIRFRFFHSNHSPVRFRRLAFMRCIVA